VPSETPEARIQALTSSLDSRGRAELERFYDSGLVLPDSLDRREITNYEVDRIARAFAIISYAGILPRRLGNEVTDFELSLDKRRARRVAHALVQASRGWRTTEPKIVNNEDVRIAAIHLNWEAFGPAHTTSVHNRMRMVATYAFKNDDLRWSKSALTRLENEINWVSYALRD
jgi:hypothetical protein